MLKSIFNRNAVAAERELGFGTRLNTEKGQRLMNPDGTFNIERECTSLNANLYFHLMRMGWAQFFLLILAFFFTVNLIFALLYCMTGVENLAGMESSDWLHNFLEASFFSTQTLTTVGYGRVAPMGLVANIVASTESLIGLLSFALVSGLLYGRFSQPISRVKFSSKALISPFKDGQALMFRMVNGGKSELIEVEVQCSVALNQTDETGNISRRFYQLDLQINKVAFFSVSWTIVHPILETSPIASFTQKDLEDANAEFFVLVKGIDESNEQTVHARRSYVSEEIEWGAKFSPIVSRNKKGLPLVITSQLGDFERLS